MGFSEEVCILTLSSFISGLYSLYPGPSMYKSVPKQIQATWRHPSLRNLTSFPRPTLSMAPTTDDNACRDKRPPPEPMEHSKEISLRYLYNYIIWRYFMKQVRFDYGYTHHRKSRVSTTVSRLTYSNSFISEVWQRSSACMTDWQRSLDCVTTFPWLRDNVPLLVHTFLSNALPINMTLYMGHHWST